MKCMSCNAVLTDFELSFKRNGESLDICMDCIDGMGWDVGREVDADMTLASESDMPLQDEWT